VEGDLFSPQQIDSIKDQVKIKCCFIGTSNITLEDLKKIDSKLDWVSKFSPEDQAKLPQQFVDRSKIIKEESEKYGFKYFDIYPDRQIAIENTYHVLMG